MWSAVTDVPKEKQGNLIALSLPNESKFGNNIKERVLERLSVSELGKEKGLESLVKFLDEELASDATTDLVNKWDEWFDFVRKPNQTIDQFIGDYELLVSRLEAAGQKLSEEIKGFALLKKAGLSSLERTLVISRLDLDKSQSIYKDIKIQCTNLLGKAMKQSKQAKDFNVKLEPTYLAEHEDTLATMGYYKRVDGGANGKKEWKNKGFNRQKNGNQRQLYKPNRKQNPKGRDRKVLTCLACGSILHLIKDCPDKVECVHVAEESK